MQKGNEIIIQMSLVFVNLPPRTLPVLTKDPILELVGGISDFLNSICSENLNALKLTLSSVFTFLHWVAMFNLSLMLPLEIELYKIRLTGPGVSLIY